MTEPGHLNVFRVHTPYGDALVFSQTEADKVSRWFSDEPPESMTGQPVGPERVYGSADEWVRDHAQQVRADVERRLKPHELLVMDQKYYGERAQTPSGEWVEKVNQQGIQNLRYGVSGSGRVPGKGLGRLTATVAAMATGEVETPAIPPENLPKTATFAMHPMAVSGDRPRSVRDIHGQVVPE